MNPNFNVFFTLIMSKLWSFILNVPVLPLLPLQVPKIQSLLTRSTLPNPDLNLPEAWPTSHPLLLAHNLVPLTREADLRVVRARNTIPRRESPVSYRWRAGIAADGERAIVYARPIGAGYFVCHGGIAAELQLASAQFALLITEGQVKRESMTPFFRGPSCLLPSARPCHTRQASIQGRNDTPSSIFSDTTSADQRRVQGRRCSPTIPMNRATISLGARSRKTRRIFLPRKWCLRTIGTYCGSFVNVAVNNKIYWCLRLGLRHQRFPVAVLLNFHSRFDRSKESVWRQGREQSCGWSSTTYSPCYTAARSTPAGANAPGGSFCALTPRWTHCRNVDSQSEFAADAHARGCAGHAQLHTGKRLVGIWQAPRQRATVFNRTRYFDTSRVATVVPHDTREMRGVQWLILGRCSEISL